MAAKRFATKVPFGQENGGRFGKTSADFHHGDQDANVPDESNNFGPDLKHDSPRVAKGLKDAGDWLTKALGVQGYRLDYVKGISFTFLRDYLNFGAMNGKFAVGEFIGNRDQLNNWTRNSMQGRASALDFPLRDLLKEMCDGKGFFQMHRLDHAGLTGINPAGSVTFVESHDTQDQQSSRSDRPEQAPRLCLHSHLRRLPGRLLQGLLRLRHEGRHQQPRLDS